MDTWRSILDPTCLGPRHVGSLEFSPRVCIYILRYLMMGPKSKHETDLLHTHTHAYTHTQSLNLFNLKTIEKNPTQAAGAWGERGFSVGNSLYLWGNKGAKNSYRKGKFCYPETALAPPHLDLLPMFVKRKFTSIKY